MEDMELRTQDTQAAHVKAQAQDDATIQLQQATDQTKLEISALRQDMQSLMRQFLTALPSIPTTPAKDNKRTPSNDDEDNSHSEKRRDVRTTPGKKLFHEEMDLRDSQQYLSAMEEDDTPPQQLND